MEWVEWGTGASWRITDYIWRLYVVYQFHSFQYGRRRGVNPYLKIRTKLLFNSQKNLQRPIYSNVSRLRVFKIFLDIVCSYTHNTIIMGICVGCNKRKDQDTARKA